EEQRSRVRPPLRKAGRDPAVARHDHRAVCSEVVTTTLRVSRIRLLPTTPSLYPSTRSCLIRSMHERALRFLVIDDEPRAGAMISELLRDLGHACVVESRGTAALTRAREFMPDVVLTELVLPDIT